MPSDSMRRTRMAKKYGRRDVGELIIYVVNSPRVLWLHL